MEIQAIIFSKKKWTVPSSQNWVYSHGYKPITNVRITDNYIRWRLRDPKKYRQFVIKPIGKNIKYIYGI